MSGTTRSGARIASLSASGIDPIFEPEMSFERVQQLAAGKQILVSFPPDGVTDARIAAACAESSGIVYLSSTAVYGAHRGEVTDETPPDGTDPRARMRLDAEDRWRDVGAVVLRCPALYDATSGLHRRLVEGLAKIPEGEGIGSRIHTEDLARYVLAALELGRRGETYVVGDLEPASHGEVIRWICARMGWPVPPTTPLDQVPVTMRASRTVNPSRALRELDVKLTYPTYREGYAAVLDSLSTGSS
jgi:nucleoside-diphosphate-sugar epimerase